MSKEKPIWKTVRKFWIRNPEEQIQSDNKKERTKLNKKEEQELINEAIEEIEKFNINDN